MSIKYHVNMATKIRRNIMKEIASAFFKGMDAEQIDRIPYNMFPKSNLDEPFRCCIYRDREVVKNRLIAALGFCTQKIDDDFLPISYYAEEALKREKVTGPALTVLDIACQSCVRAQYTISNLCRGCIARPCKMNCPVDCITIENHQAKIDTERCINCGKCKQVCPYHAVVQVPVPCEEACPVGAISKSKDGKQRINWEKCTSCGRCMRACPFGAVMEKLQIIDVLRALKSDKQVIAMCAPAIAGQFPGGLEGVAAGLKKLGFDHFVEVARGADVTCKDEAAEFKERVLEGDLDFMTTSCCPAYVEAAKKHLPDIMKHVSHTPTPMHFIARMMRKEYPEAITVFIGPCVAKRSEGIADECVDYVLTFEELGAIFDAASIETAVLDSSGFEGQAHSQGRGFALAGGVAAAVLSVADDPTKVKPVTVNGLSKDGLLTLRVYSHGKCPGNLVEVMTCEGGCINGAGVYCDPTDATAAVRKFALESKPIIE